MQQRKWEFFKTTHDNKRVVVGYRNCKAPDLTELYKQMKLDGFGTEYKEFGYANVEGEVKGYSNKVN